MANNLDPDQTPIKGVVGSGSTLFGQNSLSVPVLKVLMVE